MFGRLVSVPEIAFGPAAGHVFASTMVAGVLVVGGLAIGADPTERRHAGWFSTTQVALVLGLVAAVLALFVASQVVALTDVGQRVVAAAGLTPAEYARSGFFQLCWAAVVVVALVALARWLAAPAVVATAPVRWLGAAVPTLAVGLVVVSLRRMALYDRAFGLTMLRLAVVVAATWIALVLVLLAARNLGLWPDRDWVVGAAVVAVLVLVVGGDVADPEAFVVRHNLDRAAAGAELDVGYLDTLSDDAVPALAAAVDDEVLAARLRRTLDCERRVAGVARFNLSRHRAAAARAPACG